MIKIPEILENIFFLSIIYSKNVCFFNTALVVLVFHFKFNPDCGVMRID